MYPIIIALLPTIQIGLSFWMCGATLIAALLIVARPSIFAVYKNRDVWILGLICLGMFVSLLGSPPSDFAHAFLRIAREACAFLIMATALDQATARPVKINPALMASVMFGLAAVFLVIAIAQTAFLQRSLYFGIPRTWFVVNADMIPDLKSLRFSRLRPSGTFGEPSYFGFVCTSLFLMTMPYWSRSRLAGLAAVCLAATAALTQSIAFILAIWVVFYAGFVMRRGARFQVFFVVGSALAGAVLLTSTMIGTRVLGSAQSGVVDSSTFGRIVGPTLVAGRFLVDHPFGANFFDLPRVLQEYSWQLGFMGSEFLHNAMFNAIFCYGLFAIPLLYFTFRRAADAAMLAYLVVSTCFNGAFFSLDKVAVISLTASVYCAGKYLSRIQEERRLSLSPLAQPQHIVTRAGAGSSR